MDFHWLQKEKGMKKLTLCSLGMQVMNSTSPMRNFSFYNNPTIPKMIEYGNIHSGYPWQSSYSAMISKCFIVNGLETFFRKGEISFDFYWKGRKDQCRNVSQESFRERFSAKSFWYVWYRLLFLTTRRCTIRAIMMHRIFDRFFAWRRTTSQIPRPKSFRLL